MIANETSASSDALPTTGAALRSLREAQGLTLEDVSRRIKFSSTQVRALEDERWDALPTGVSLRGLVRSYARMLGADEASLVASVAPPTGTSSLRPVDDAAHPQARVTARVPLAADDAHGGIAWGWLLIILLFVAAGATYAFWQGWLPQHWLPAGWL